ncbi:MAG TPA: GntR family transcriptional regulator [Candidatus Aquilonibacter sp.]|nr:GntR family transcriptional regulator [Candidatus Aquilonibacter sp.]
MRFWFAPHSDVPIYRQLATQVQLAILSGDLRAGDRLPSTREMARRFAIHPNTVSAGYRELEREGWTELRHGSGVYVCDRHAPRAAESGVNSQTDTHIEEFFRRAHQLGISSTALRERLVGWVAAPPADHWLLVDSDAQALQVLMTELRAATERTVRGCAPDGCFSTELAGAIVCCRPSQERDVRSAVPAGIEVLALPITSANEWLMPWLPARQGLLIAVVSHWPEFLDKARTMLAAAGVPSEALIFCDARKPAWQRGLEDTSGILCDAYTASAVKLPKGPQIVVFPLLAKSAREVLAHAWL